MRKLLLVFIAVLLAGCAGFGGYGIQAGTPRDAVIAQMGPPTRVMPLPAGERLQYGAQPYGRETWMVDLDAGGRVVQSRQVLDRRQLPTHRGGQVDA